MALLSTFWTDFLGRFDGPLHFRLFVQPLMAMLFATGNGRRDAREGRSAYLWGLLTDPAQRRYLLESGWKGISKVFVLARRLWVSALGRPVRTAELQVLGRNTTVSSKTSQALSGKRTADRILDSVNIGQRTNMLRRNSLI